MSKKAKHHYVPRLYLKQFASQPKRINVHILATNEFKQNVSLKDQCQRPRFYGTTDEVEDDLMKLEGIVSPALNKIIQHSSLPEVGNAERAHLLLFAAFQVSRTPMAAGNMTEGFNKMLDLVKPKNSSTHDNFDKRKMDFDFALLESLRNAGVVAEYWADLEIHLILNVGGDAFFTSDNPVVLYNQYCEGLKGLELLVRPKEDSRCSYPCRRGTLLSFTISMSTKLVKEILVFPRFRSARTWILLTYCKQSMRTKSCCSRSGEMSTR